MSKKAMTTHTMADPQSPSPSSCSEPTDHGDETSAPAKRQRTQDANYEYDSMTEYLDPAGLECINRQLNALLARSDLPAKQRARGVHFQPFLAGCDA